MAEERNAKPESEPAKAPPAEPKPDPSVKAPALVWISKGYDPRLPNPKRVRERGKDSDS